MSSAEDNIILLKAKCQKIVDGKKSKTRIGMTVNELRKKTEDKNLAKRAKALIKKWKALIDGGGKEGSSKGGGEKEDSPASQNSQPNGTPAPEVAVSRSNAPRLFKRTAAASSDENRCKSITALANALKSGELPDGTQDPEELAERVEEALFQQVGGVNDRYRSSIRSRLFNLRDKKNPALRENVLTGAVSAKRFAAMTAEEMASDEMKKQREAFTKEAILEHQMSVQEGTPSDMFRCGRCGKNNCTYTQVQTRSADEPMTTFVFCRSCGNRWKFC